MKRVTDQIFAVIAGVMFVVTVHAYDVAVEFSAKAVQTVPSRPAQQAKMFVSKDSVRRESLINNVPVIEIVNAKKMTRLLLIPGEKIYLQEKGDKTLSATFTEKSASGNPCQGLPDTTCKKLGMEKINDRQTEKWEFTVKRNDQTYRSLHWIDSQRHMPIREFYPDGTVTELLFQGKETMNKRKTEKWLMQITRADGQKMQSTQWYDPELKMTIREEMQGGFVRELQNISTGKQDARLFEVPKGYRKVEQLPGYLLPQQPEIRTK